MAREEESRHKSRKHRRDHERDEDKDYGERERKKSKGEKPLKEPTSTVEATMSRRSGTEAAEPNSSPLENGRGAGESREDANGEVSMSIEETNRVRLSLGLKPLQVEKTADKERAAHAAAVAAKAEEQRKAEEAAMADHIKERREHRRQQEKLKKVKTLGEAGADVDDLAAWVNRNKKAEKKAKDLERLKAERQAKHFEEQDEEASDEEQLANGTELGGMKVKHDANELNEGETMILTLADRRILDDKGALVEDPEELENVLVTEDKLRRKAFKAASKENKPLFGEDGKVQGLLEKYDEEVEDEGMLIDEQGAIEAAKRKRQADIREKLRAVESAATDAKPTFESKGDYYTAEEMASFSKPKSQKKRKIRKKAVESEEGTLDIAALEAEAAAAGEAQDRGSRADKASRDAKAAEERAAKLQERRDRYDNALKKANIASLALQQQAASEEDADEGDDDLQASLERARRAARAKAESSKQPDEGVAAQAARRRREQEQRREQEGGLEFSEAKDFANSIHMIQVKEEAEEPQDTEMHEEDKPPVAPTPPPQRLPPPPAQQAQPSLGGWVSADKVKEEVDEEMPDAAEVKQEELDSMVRERTVGQGLGNVMDLLRERGELQKGPEWAGRTNDLKGQDVADLGDIYKGGNHTDRIAASIERALTQTDAHGRVMTPKERFRDLCHNFHGKDISKGKQEKRERKIKEELDAKRAATGEGSSRAFSRIGGQQVAGTPYTVLSGNVQPGQSSDPASGFQTVERRMAPTPVLGGATPIIGGGDTPLIGDRKVEVMLGVKKEPGTKEMPPPPSRNFRKK